MYGIYNYTNKQFYREEIMNRKKIKVKIAKRIQYEVTKPQAQVIDGLINRTGAGSQRGLINQALSFMKWVIGEKEDVVKSSFNRQRERHPNRNNFTVFLKIDVAFFSISRGGSGSHPFTCLF